MFSIFRLGHDDKFELMKITISKSFPTSVKLRKYNMGLILESIIMYIIASTNLDRNEIFLWKFT
jgi:hypothetical protein